MLLLFLTVKPHCIYYYYYFGIHNRHVSSHIFLIPGKRFLFSYLSPLTLHSHPNSHFANRYRYTKTECCILFRNSPQCYLIMFRKDLRFHWLLDFRDLKLMRLTLLYCTSNKRYFTIDLRLYTVCWKMLGQGWLKVLEIVISIILPTVQWKLIISSYSRMT